MAAEEQPLPQPWATTTPRSAAGVAHSRMKIKGTRPSDLATTFMISAPAIASLTALAVTVTPTAPAAQAAEESISVDFAASGAVPTYRTPGWIYGMAKGASGPGRTHPARS
jgi:hypothetical protein